MTQSNLIGRVKPAVSVVALAILGGGAGAYLMNNGVSPVPVNMVSVHAATEEPFSHQGFAQVVKRVTPAVVNISTSKVVKVSQRGMGNMQVPRELRDFFNFGNPGMEAPQNRREQSLGSGVIVDPRGYVLTNNHVVEGATSVKVSLADRRELNATVVGTDPQTDVAVLKIEGSNFPSLTVGDSSKAQVGDIALAVGNPFGIGQTVTMGIIGATGRSGLGIENYEDFIQTDAAINPGNSGGALVDTKGNLIAINTAILSGNSGGNQGIGFAIPINMAREVMDQLVKNGKVVRGYMGVQIDTLTPTIARAFHLPEATDGVVISSVEPDGPAAKAGIQVGDVITSVDGVSVADRNTFRLRVSRTAPGSPITFKVNRDGGPRDIRVMLAAFPKQPGETGEKSAPGQSEGALQGITVEPLTPQTANQLRLPARTQGLVVTEVDPSSAAAQAGLHEGDVIQSVNRKPVTSVADFESAMRNAGSSGALLLVNRNGATSFVAIEASGK